MNKLAVLLTAVLAAGIVTMKMADGPSEVSPQTVENERALQERVANYQCFKQVLDGALEGLEKREIGLKAAHARVAAAAREHHPAFYERLRDWEPGASDEERLAHNLVGHLQSMAEDRTHLEPRIRELEMELQEFLCECRSQRDEPGTCRMTNKKPAFICRCNTKSDPSARTSVPGSPPAKR